MSESLRKHGQVRKAIIAQREVLIDLGIPTKIANCLAREASRSSDSNLMNPETLANMSLEDLRAIRGFGDKLASKLHSTIQGAIILMERDRNILTREEREHAIRVIGKLVELVDDPMKKGKETPPNIQSIIGEIIYDKIHKLDELIELG